MDRPILPAPPRHRGLPPPRMRAPRRPGSLPPTGRKTSASPAGQSVRTPPCPLRSSALPGPPRAPPPPLAQRTVLWVPCVPGCGVCPVELIVLLWWCCERGMGGGGLSSWHLCGVSRTAEPARLYRETERLPSWPVCTERDQARPDSTDSVKGKGEEGAGRRLGAFREPDSSSLSHTCTRSRSRSTASAHSLGALSLSESLTHSLSLPLLPPLPLPFVRPISPSLLSHFALALALALALHARTFALALGLGLALSRHVPPHESSGRTPHARSAAPPPSPRPWGKRHATNQPSLLPPRPPPSPLSGSAPHTRKPAAARRSTEDPGPAKADELQRLAAR
jgi:hypothetical protein